MASDAWAEAAVEEIQRLKAEVEKWRKIADMFHSRHDYGRTCALISRCWECEAYQKAISGEQTV